MPSLGRVVYTTGSVVRGVASFLWTLIPILLFFILLSIFVNSTDRSFVQNHQSGNEELRRSAFGVDYLPRDLHQAQEWGCFDRAVDTGDIHWVPGTTVLVNCADEHRNGVYMAVPGEGPELLEFVCLRPLVVGETYTISSGDFAGMVYTVRAPSNRQQWCSSADQDCPLPPPVSDIEHTTTFLASSLEKQPNGNLSVPLVCDRREITVVVDESSRSDIVLDTSSWLPNYMLTVSNPQLDTVKVVTPNNQIQEIASGTTVRLWYLPDGNCGRC